MDLCETYSCSLLNIRGSSFSISNTVYIFRLVSGFLDQGFWTSFRWMFLIVAVDGSEREEHPFRNLFQFLFCLNMGYLQCLPFGNTGFLRTTFRTVKAKVPNRKNLPAILTHGLCFFSFHYDFGMLANSFFTKEPIRCFQEVWVNSRHPANCYMDFHYLFHVVLTGYPGAGRN